jgi:hypothetical protein
MVEIILYKKYKGPVNKFNWCPVVIVKVFGCVKAEILCSVAFETSIF